MRKLYYLQSAFTAIAVTLCILATSPTSQAQASNAQSDAIALHRQGHVEVPPGSIHRPEDLGKRAHTNVLLWRDATPRVPGPLVQNSQPSSAWETPASIACVYDFVTQVPGCPIASTTALPTGGGVIAIVDAYDDPNAASDLATFSSYFNLPQPNFQVVYASGVQPPVDTLYQGTWEAEESLDIEWAHAMAPSAQIILVEAASNSYTDLMAAETTAGQLVSQAGGGVVSNSWGGQEFNGSSNGGVSETSYDSHFLATNVVFTASTGDYLTLEWPGASPNVLAVGGTSLSRDGSGNFIGESYWDDPSTGQGGGGGLSLYESIPSYQSSIQSIVGTLRGAPDLSSNADPASGVAIYDSFPYVGVSEGWLVGDGTSLSSPTIAGRANAGGILSSTGSLQNYIYGEYAAGTAYTTNFRDITSGSSSCVSGWDICSGIGSPLGMLELPPAPPFLPTHYTCSGNVSNPQGPTLNNDGDAELVGAGGKKNNIARCVYTAFTTSSYLTTAPMTLSFDAYADSGEYGTAYIQVSGHGTVISGSYSGTYTVTVPANTDLSTFAVTGYAKASSIPGDEAEVDLGTMTIQ